VGNNYQRRLSKDTTRTPVSVPEQVTVAFGELSGQLAEGLLSLAVATGLQVMSQVMEAYVEALAGPRGRHDKGRTAVRHGSGAGSVTLGGRRVPVVRPRVRAADGSGELPVPAYDLFSSTELLGRLAMEKMLAGLSTRRYPVGLEPVGIGVEQTARSTSKSAVSRRFVAATQTALAQLMAADLSGVELVALMVDGVHFADHLCIVALGIDTEGVKHPLSLVEGSTENTTLVRELLVGLRERGLDTTRPVLAVLDGSKALAAGVREVFDRPVIARCQLHKIRNVRDKLPDKLRSVVESRMRAAYGAGSELEAKAALLTLAGELDKTRPGAAASLREGLRGDTDRATPRGAADAGPHAALDQRDRVDDRDLPQPRPQRQALAGRADGAALVRRRHGRGRRPVPPGQRPPAPGQARRRTRASHRRNCRRRPAQ